MAHNVENSCRSYSWESDWFACPACKGSIALRDELLCCQDCGSDFAIKKGIPVFLPSVLSKSEEQEHHFWENSYTKEDDGSFKTLTDVSYSEIVESFEIGSTEIGLELACGSGVFANQIPCKKMLGLDISLALLSASKKMIGIQGSGDRFPFKSKLFDFIFCAAALHHMPNLSATISEISRTLLPDGRVFVFEPNMYHPQRWLVESSESFWRKVFASTNFSPAENLIRERLLVELLEQNGFRDIQIRYYTPEYRNPSWLGWSQFYLAKLLARGPLKKFVHSYFLLSARKAD
jgi:SAM-dependent methyltransferase